MPHRSEKHRRREVALDAIASRFGILIVIGILLAVCVGAAIYIKSIVAQSEQNHMVFLDLQPRYGYAAMYDIERLVMVAQRAAEAGEITPELRDEFSKAADIMYVRADSFKRMISAANLEMESGLASMAAIDAIVEMADKAISEEFPDNPALLASLVRANIEASRNIVQFLDEMRIQAQSVLKEQSEALNAQKTAVFVLLLGLTLAASIAMFLLRSEVMARHAREAAEERVRFLAYFDHLTGLPNRAQFQQQLADTLEQGNPLALLYIDLDEFKLINDNFGHLAGDAVLRHVGRILSNMANGGPGFAARLGGDEFALVIMNDDITELSALCDYIIEKTAEPLLFEGDTFHVGASIGLATTTQVASRAAITIDMLSRVTDFALYTSKAAGRKCFTVYDRTIEKRFWERRELVEELPRAIEQGALEMYLQPKVSLPNRTVYGFEALVRWRRNGQLMLPGDFIKIAEDSGLVVDIDHFVLDRSSQLVSTWNARHGTDFSLSVNLSALNFNSAKIEKWVEQALWNSKLPAHLLTLEITETSEMRDWKQASEILSEIKGLGCKIAIDDFGTGFSSLAYLRTMKAQELKIDKSLVTELVQSHQARLLLTSVLDMARHLELEVVVEGIETDNQADIVCTMGASHAQGFLFGRPAPANEALEMAMSSLDKPKKLRAS